MVIHNSEENGSIRYNAPPADKGFTDYFYVLPKHCRVHQHLYETWDMRHHDVFSSTHNDGEQRIQVRVIKDSFSASVRLKLNYS